MSVNDYDLWLLTLGPLAAGIINEHIDNCSLDREGADGDVQCEQCCPKCCAPCGALLFIRDQADEALTRSLNENWPSSSFVWQNPDGSVNWAMINRHWGDCDTMARHG